MDDTEDNKNFRIEYAKTGRAVCKKCKEKCEAKVLRIAKCVVNPFGSGKLNNWYHIDCIFDSFKTQRATTSTIETIDDISGWETIGDLDKDSIMAKLVKLPTFNPTPADALAISSIAGGILHNLTDDKEKLKHIDRHYKEESKDNLFKEFRKVCCKLVNESSYTGKTEILNNYFQKGCNGEHFEGKLFIWIKMLLPSADKRVYNLQSKQLIKLFARMFNCDLTEMMVHLEQGDVANTISEFFEKSDTIKPVKHSHLKIEEVDEFLNELSKITKEDEQILCFRKICKKCSLGDLEMIIRLIKHDIRINAGPKHILEALSKDAYPAYQSSRNLMSVVTKFGGDINKSKLDIFQLAGTKSVKGSVEVQLMFPISPMLADACKSVEKAIAKCPAGMYSEIKYDGERVQLHKKGDEFKFFSRNLKPVQEHKIKGCQEFIPQAFPNANDLILDSEIIAVDTTTGELLPFGTLGKHKINEHRTAQVCLFVFDCIYYNGVDLTKKTMKERRKILEDNITPIKNHVQLSEYHFLKNEKELKIMIDKVLKMGLEGLVLKNINGTYEPGKRHWLKVKKDYLFDGQMADAADLVVLGAWFGTGKKGGMLSIFLMGCRDTRTNLWRTVTKVHTGLDDKTMDKMQKILKPLMYRCDPDVTLRWLNCKKPQMPDMIAKDVYLMPVWEISGAEFTKSDIHTADGISIRFPRITKQRDDKSPMEATTLQELHKLYQASKDCTNLQALTDSLDDENLNIQTKVQCVDRSPVKKSKISKNESDDEDNKDIEIDEDDGEFVAKCQKTEVKENKKSKKRILYDVEGNSCSSGDENENLTKNTKLSECTASKIGKYEKEKKTDNTIQNKSATIKQVGDVEHATRERETVADGVIESAAVAAATVKPAKKPEINIFENVRLYIPAELRDIITNELRYFQLWGGCVEINSTKKCTHVLHEKSFTTLKLNDLRKKFVPFCRHVQYSWLVESVHQKAMAEVEQYPVVIRLK